MDTETPSLDPDRAAPTTAPPPPSPLKGNRERLHELGYAQELLRKTGGLSNSPSPSPIISVLSVA